jgi:predicted acetyltransferase
MNLKEIKLEQATLEAKTRLENLMSLYLHDLSEFTEDLKVSEDGKFHYEGFELYFTSEDLKPFFITYKGEVAGFILLNSGRYVPADIDYIIHEFFLLKGYRRKGIGTAAIRNLMGLYKGKYRLLEIVSNRKAVAFWTRFYEVHQIKYSEVKEIHDGIECVVQSFEV